MRVLHMTPELPFHPGGGGGRIREFFFCRRLTELGHQVLNLSPALASEVPRAEALREVGVETWIAERPASQLREAAQAAVREPQVLASALRVPLRALEMRVFWVELRRLADRALREWRPDIAVVGHDMAAAWAPALSLQLPAVITLHNLTWHWYLSRAARHRGPASLALRAEAIRYERHVLRLLPRYRAAVAVSTIEADELRRRTSVPVETIPTGVDTQATRPAPEPAGAPRLLFAATLDYPPNVEGIRWFVDRVWPGVRRRIPAARLDVVGRNPTPSVQSLNSVEGVEVVGSVRTMEPYYARARAVIVPILTGAGIRVKIVEAMAAGRAVVSTSLGWEGLPFVEPGRHLLVGDEPAEFGDAVIRLLEDEELRRRLVSAARRLAEEHYDWRGLGDAQAAVLERVLEEKQVSAGPPPVV